MHDFNMFRALFSDSISVRFAAWQVKDALGTTMLCVASVLALNINMGRGTSIIVQAYTTQRRVLRPVRCDVL